MVSLQGKEGIKVCNKRNLIWNHCKKSQEIYSSHKNMHVCLQFWIWWLCLHFVYMSLHSLCSFILYVTICLVFVYMSLHFLLVYFLCIYYCAYCLFNFCLYIIIFPVCLNFYLYVNVLTFGLIFICYCTSWLFNICVSALPV